MPEIIFRNDTIEKSNWMQSLPGYQNDAEITRAALEKSGKVTALKGGPGSGNKGHAGRPGKVGGSAPKADGVDKFDPKNPMDSEAFRLWFWDSKIVDKQGKPLVVYHGTRSDFTKFDRRDGSANPYLWNDNAVGFFFAARPSEAAAFAGYKLTEGEPDAPEGANVMPVFLCIRNPKVYGFAEYLKTVETFDNPIEFRESLIALGFDGIVRLSPSGARDNYIAFFSEQIKSATGNSGAFDPIDPDITKDFKGGPGSGHFGHAGRPGKKGGSARSGGSGSVLDTMVDPESAEFKKAGDRFKAGFKRRVAVVVADHKRRMLANGNYVKFEQRLNELRDVLAGARQDQSQKDMDAQAALAEYQKVADPALLNRLHQQADNRIDFLRKKAKTEIDLAHIKDDKKLKGIQKQIDDLVAAKDAAYEKWHAEVDDLSFQDRRVIEATTEYKRFTESAEAQKAMGFAEAEAGRLRERLKLPRSMEVARARIKGLADDLKYDMEKNLQETADIMTVLNDEPDMPKTDFDSYKARLAELSKDRVERMGPEGHRLRAHLAEVDFVVHEAVAGLVSDGPKAKTTVTLHPDHAANDEAVIRIGQAQDEFQRMVGDNPMAEYSVRTWVHPGRAYAQESEIYVRLVPDRSTVIHEMGHTLENNDWLIKNRAIAFLDRRTEGEYLEPLKAVTHNNFYQDDEYTQKDRFLDPYIGKAYHTGEWSLPKGQKTGAPKKLRSATEVISMGLQLLYTQVLDVAHRDPEYFDFLFGFLNCLPLTV